MNAVPPSFTAAHDPHGQSAASATAMRWAALNDAANVIAALAGVEPERPPPADDNFPALLSEAEEWRRERAEYGVADLAAIMEPGIAALLSVTARGADPRPAAQSLWREFVASRAAILALMPA
jgi:hypothetical protein